MTYIPTVNLGYGGQLDAANRLRVSQLTTLGDYRQFWSNDKQPLYFDEKQIGSSNSTHTLAEGGVVMTVSDETGYVIRQSKMWHNYQSGHSHLIELTSTDFHPQPGVIKRAGYFSSSRTAPYTANLDGIFLETSDGNEHTFNVYKGGTQVLSVAQSAWSEDKLDGSGPSGLLMSGDDWRKFSVFAVDFLYLGGTSAALGIFYKRQFYPCHIYNHSFTNNTIQAPMIISPNQPVRYEIRGIEGGIQGTFTHICSQVASEGSIDSVGISIGLDSGTSPVNANTSGTSYALLGVKLDPTYKALTAIPKSITTLSTNTVNYRWELLLNPTVAGGGLSWAGVTNTGLDIGTSDKANPSSNTVTGGTQLAVGYGSSNSLTQSISSPLLRIGSFIDSSDGPAGDGMDTLVLSVTPLAANADVYGAINMEVFK